MKTYYVITEANNRYRRYVLTKEAIEQAIDNGWSNTPQCFDSEEEAYKSVEASGGAVLKRYANDEESVVLIVGQKE